MASASLASGVATNIHISVMCSADETWCAVMFLPRNRESGGSYPRNVGGDVDSMTSARAENEPAETVTSTGMSGENPCRHRAEWRP